MKWKHWYEVDEDLQLTKTVKPEWRLIAYASPIEDGQIAFTGYDGNYVYLLSSDPL